MLHFITRFRLIFFIVKVTVVQGGNILNFILLVMVCHCLAVKIR